MDKLKCKVVMLKSEHLSKDDKPVICKYNNNFLEIDYEPLLVKDPVAQHLYFISDREIKEGDWFIDVTRDTYKKPFLCDLGPTNNFILTKNINFPIEGCKKIEATTDSSLGLPLIGKSFIEKYVEKQGTIKEVMIEMVEIVNCPENHHRVNLEIAPYVDSITYCPKCVKSFIPKTRKDNTVIISPIKDSWTREEVKEAIYLYQSTNTYFKVKESGLSLTKYIDKWIEENLD